MEVHNIALLIGLSLAMLTFDLFAVVRSKIQLFLYNYEFGEDCVIKEKSRHCRAYVDCSLFNVVNKIRELPNHENLTLKKFTRVYLYGARPVVMRNITVVKQPQNYNLEMVKSLHGDDVENRRRRDKKCHFFSEVGNLINLTQALNMDMNTNHWYAAWNLCDMRVKNTLLKYFLNIPKFFPSSERSKKSYFDYLFFGTKGQGVDMHIDVNTGPSWQAQVTGVSFIIHRSPLIAAT